ncbi:MAG TPA: FKBP-type peptidyl-prolyl cis-trans isomerase [Candidatus Polarisedimenticolaceae bacterium]|nr:FKBP-type peptidyl-prolyl cis-trans isomerase [Candidatus Polarisedimenticolaceae bacterium]
MRTTGVLAALAAAVLLSTLAPAADAPASKVPDTPQDVAAPPADAEKTASGLAFKVLRPGTGTEHPKVSDVITVHYAGWTTDGKPFDSSYGRGTPMTMPLSRMIDGWKEGLQLMVPGEMRRFWIPEELAYKGRPGRPQGMLVFDVELISIGAPPPSPPPAAK